MPNKKAGSQFDISIIVVSWNTRSMLQDCLSSLLHATSSGLTVEVVVVDNASTDGSPEMVAAMFPQVGLVANQENMGFAAANNQAAHRVNGRYLLFLNPDTLVLENSLQKMLAYADAHPACGVLGPRMIDPDHTRQRSCWPNFPGLGMAFSDAFYFWKAKRFPSGLTNEFRPGQLLSTQRVAHILGACMLIRQETWQTAGPLDEEYFMYMEETSFCYRAQEQGWEVVYYPEAEIIHYGQRSSRQIPENSLKSYYTSYYRFCKKVRGYSGFQLWLLKKVMLVAVDVRLGLWKWRKLRAADLNATRLSEGMFSGYKAARETINSLI